MIGEGNASVTLSSAKFSDSADAANEDLSAASITVDSVSVTASKPEYSVTLSNHLSGNSKVIDGTAYTFRISDTDSAYYTYTITATMGGKAVDLITDNGNGSYTISNVTGALVITATRKAKTFDITYESSTGVHLPSAATAAYGTNFTFTIPQNEGYTTAVISITYQSSGNPLSYTISDDNTVTIDGAAVIDNILIVIDQEKIPTHASVTVNGNGAADVTDFVNLAELGQPYTLTVAIDPRYTYSITAKVGDIAVTVSGSNDSYTIAGIDVVANVTFTVTKTLKLVISCDKYLTLDGSVLWLITNHMEKADNKVYTYNGNEMFWSEKYQAYCTLVVSTAQPDTDETFFALIDGTTAAVNYNHDVNMSGIVDANDAQFAYNMYQAMYNGISNKVTVEKYLRADVNGDKKVDTTDAVVIVHAILNIK